MTLKNEDQTPIVLTGMTFECKIRRSKNEPVLASADCDIIDELMGQVRIRFTASQTNSLPDVEKLESDVVAFYANDTSKRILIFDFDVETAITR